jgi:hypothetical protein
MKVSRCEPFPSARLSGERKQTMVAMSLSIGPTEMLIAAVVAAIGVHFWRKKRRS